MITSSADLRDDLGFMWLLNSRLRTCRSASANTEQFLTVVLKLIVPMQSFDLVLFRM